MIITNVSLYSFFFFSSRRRHTRLQGDWSSDVCSSDLPDFDFCERRTARVFGWHRALKMWSTINRGTPQNPGLVFGMLSGGSCQGMVFRIPRHHGHDVMKKLWQREMANAVYDPRWLPCRTGQGTV